MCADGANRAPRTTQLCKRLFPEEIYLPICFKAYFPILRKPLHGELANLLGEEYAWLVNRFGIGQQFGSRTKLISIRCPHAPAFRR